MNSQMNKLTDLLKYELNTDEYVVDYKKLEMSKYKFSEHWTALSRVDGIELARFSKTEDLQYFNNPASNKREYKYECHIMGKKVFSETYRSVVGDKDIDKRLPQNMQSVLELLKAKRNVDTDFALAICML